MSVSPKYICIPNASAPVFCQSPEAMQRILATKTSDTATKTEMLLQLANNAHKPVRCALAVLHFFQLERLPELQLLKKFLFKQYTEHQTTITKPMRTPIQTSIKTAACNNVPAHNTFAQRCCQLHQQHMTRTQT